MAGAFTSAFMHQFCCDLHIYIYIRSQVLDHRRIAMVNLSPMHFTCLNAPTSADKF
jgi:hypothetical protein